MLAAAERAALGLDAVGGNLRRLDGAGDRTVRMEFALVLADRDHGRVVAELFEAVDRLEQFENLFEVAVRPGRVRRSGEESRDRQGEQPHPGILPFPRALMRSLAGEATGGGGLVQCKDGGSADKSPRPPSEQPSTVARRISDRARAARSRCPAGRGTCGSVVNSTPLALSEAIIASRSFTNRPKWSSP